MNPDIGSYHIFPLGDSAITVDFGNVINEAINEKVLGLFDQLKQEPLPAMIEAVPSYSSLTIYYNVFEISKKQDDNKTAFDKMTELLKQRLEHFSSGNKYSSKEITIPVCYDKEFAPDIEYLAAEKNITIDELINLHLSKTYRVFMLGFLPGFSYMGEVNEKIAIPRKSQPVTVEAGSVGVAGRQTGVYPMACPGGWQIIGRSPIKLFDPAKEEPTLLKAGDRVKFISISKDEFENY